MAKIKGDLQVVRGRYPRSIFALGVTMWARSSACLRSSDRLFLMGAAALPLGPVLCRPDGARSAGDLLIRGGACG